MDKTQETIGEIVKHLTAAGFTDVTFTAEEVDLHGVKAKRDGKDFEYSVRGVDLKTFLEYALGVARQQKRP